jgi:hypothetical protein
MFGRRRLIASLMALPFLRPARAAARAAPAAVPLGGGFHLLDGWILTDADLRAIARHDP